VRKAKINLQTISRGKKYPANRPYARVLTLVNYPEGALRRQLNAIKDEQFPWMNEVTKCAPQHAIMNLGRAFENLFRDLKKPKKERHFRYPKPKKKGFHDSFTISNDQFKVEDSRIHIPKLGWVRMHEPLRYAGAIQSATISREANRWYVSITVNAELCFLPHENQGAVGVDLGITALATLSDGEPVPGPRALKARLGRLRRLQRSLSRKKIGSANRKKAKAKVAQLHARVANIRNDAVNKLTSMVTRKHGLIGLENLNVRGMMKNRKLARSIADASFYEVRRQFVYKGARRGCTLVFADRWFPSSKKCSTAGCGYIIDKLPLRKRYWTCPACGTRHHRDLNSATNLKNLAVEAATSASSAAVKVAQATVACGEASSGGDRKIDVKLASEKQEVSIGSAMRRLSRYDGTATVPDAPAGQPILRQAPAAAAFDFKWPFKCAEVNGAEGPHTGAPRVRLPTAALRFLGGYARLPVARSRRRRGRS